MMLLLLLQVLLDAVLKVSMVVTTTWKGTGVHAAAGWLAL